MPKQILTFFLIFHSTQLLAITKRNQIKVINYYYEYYSRANGGMTPYQGYIGRQLFRTTNYWSLLPNPYRSYEEDREYRFDQSAFNRALRIQTAWGKKISSQEAGLALCFNYQIISYIENLKKTLKQKISFNEMLRLYSKKITIPKINFLYKIFGEIGSQQLLEINPHLPHDILTRDKNFPGDLAKLIFESFGKEQAFKNIIFLVKEKKINMNRALDVIIKLKSIKHWEGGITLENIIQLCEHPSGGSFEYIPITDRQLDEYQEAFHQELTPLMALDLREKFISIDAVISLKQLWSKDLSLDEIILLNGAMKLNVIIPLRKAWGEDLDMADIHLLAQVLGGDQSYGTNYLSPYYTYYQCNRFNLENIILLKEAFGRELTAQDITEWSEAKIDVKKLCSLKLKSPDKISPSDVILLAQNHLFETEHMSELDILTKDLKGENSCLDLTDPRATNICMGMNQAMKMRGNCHHLADREAVRYCLLTQEAFLGQHCYTSDCQAILKAFAGPYYADCKKHPICLGLRKGMENKNCDEIEDHNNEQKTFCMAYQSIEESPRTFRSTGRYYSFHDYLPSKNLYKYYLSKMARDEVTQYNAFWDELIDFIDRLDSELEDKIKQLLERYPLISSLMIKGEGIAYLQQSKLPPKAHFKLSSLFYKLDRSSAGIKELALNLKKAISEFSFEDYPPLQILRDEERGIDTSKMPEILRDYFKIVLENYFDLLPLTDKKRILVNLHRAPPDSASDQDLLSVVLDYSGPSIQKLFQLFARETKSEYLQKVFEKLHDNVAPFSFEEVEAVLQEVLGENYQQHFSSFERSPLAQATVAQVHHAQDRDGVDIAVKIMRPNIKERALRELAILKDLASYHDGLKQIIIDLEISLMEELDFISEGKNTFTAHDIYTDEGENIAVVQINPNYPLASNFMVTYLAPGVALHRVQPYLGGLLELEKSLTSLLKIWFTEALFKSGTIIADSHSGNMLWECVDPKLTLLDFASMGTLSPTEQKALIGILISITNKNAQGLLKYFNRIIPLKEEDLPSLKEKIEEIFFEEESEDKSNNQILAQIFNVIIDYNYHIPRNLTLFNKGIILLEQHLERLPESPNPEEIYKEIFKSKMLYLFFRGHRLSGRK